MGILAALAFGGQINDIDERLQRIVDLVRQLVCHGGGRLDCRLPDQLFLQALLPYCHGGKVRQQFKHPESSLSKASVRPWAATQIVPRCSSTRQGIRMPSVIVAASTPSRSKNCCETVKSCGRSRSRQSPQALGN